MSFDLAVAEGSEGSEIAQFRFSEQDWKQLNSLTPLQRRFVLEYPKDFNAKAAAERAGYKGGAYAQANRGWELLRHPVVNPLIRKLTASTAEEMGITREWLLNEIQEVASEMRERGESSARELALLAKLRGDLIERVEHDVRHVVVQVNGVDVEDLR
jgi:hypothetical protein